MAITGGPEAVENAVAATLAAHLNTWLDLLNTQAADNMPSLHPALVHAGQLDLVREYPTVIVASVDGVQTLDGALVWGQVEHHLAVVAFCASDTQALLDRMTKRYIWAIWHCLMQNQPLDGSLSGLAGVSLTRYGRSPIAPSDKKGLLERSLAWLVTVNMLESV